MGFFSTLSLASMPVLKVFLMGAIGWLLASSRLSILSADARKHLNKLVFVVFTPALVFSNISQAVTPAVIITWWPLPINVILSFLVGAAIGLMIVKILKPAPHLEHLTIACCSAGNVGNLPLLLIPAACMEPNSPFGEPQTCIGRGIAYASFGLCAAVLMLWTFIYNLLQPISSQTTSGDPSNVISMATVSQYLKEDSQDEELSLLCPVKDIHLEASTNPAAQSRSSIFIFKCRTAWDMQWTHAMKPRLKGVINPPNIAVMAALFAVGVPALKRTLIGPNAPLRFIQDSLNTLGNAMLPCIILLLGGSLSQGIRSSSMKASLVAGIVVTRLLILPVVGICLVWVGSHLGILPSDPLFRLVLLLQHTMPTAMTVGTISELFGAMEDVSVVLFWSYLSSTVTITMWTMVYVSLLF